jgi:two-component system, cell cycle sensor histidine kinase and response regulator CckA
VDDEESIRKMLTRTLTQLGIQVSLYSNGAQALRAFKEDPDRYDLIITDQTMPEMTGITFAKEVAMMSPKTPVVMATGNVAVITEEEMEQAHLIRLLNKPIQLTELKKCIKDILITGV